MPRPYNDRIEDAADAGDLNALADLLNEGAKGSGILTDSAVTKFTVGLREIAARQRFKKVVAVVLVVAAFALGFVAA